MGARLLAFGEANGAVREGVSVAVNECVVCGPQLVRMRLAELGGFSRTALADAAGLAVVEEVDEPRDKRCGISTLLNGGS